MSLVCNCLATSTRTSRSSKRCSGKSCRKTAMAATRAVEGTALPRSRRWGFLSPGCSWSAASALLCLFVPTLHKRLHKLHGRPWPCPNPAPPPPPRRLHLHPLLGAEAFPVGCLTAAPTGGAAVVVLKPGEHLPGGAACHGKSHEVLQELAPASSPDACAGASARLLPRGGA